MDQAQSEYLVEIEELVEQIYLDLDALRNAGSKGKQRRDLIDQVFRRVHSVKGSAASFGLQVVSQIAHEFENLLAAARSGHVILDDTALDTCESAVDALRESLTLAAAGIVEPSHNELFERLQTATNLAVPVTDATDETVSDEIWPSLTDSERNRLAEATREGSSIFIVTVSFDIANFDEPFLDLKRRLNELGEVISTAPALDEARPEQISFRILFAGRKEAGSDEVSLAAFPTILFTRVRPETTSTETVSPSVASVSSLGNVVHTNLDVLDRVISSTHQLFRDTSQALDCVSTLSAEELRQLSEKIKSDFLHVEDELINLRMVSIGPTLQRAMRAGKTVARLTGKEVDFEVSGEDLQLDKLLVDAIGDPLIHLVRNAVDHGIESAETRRQAGKTKCGRVRIEAVSEGGRSRVTVSDDGRGIDPSVVSSAARRLGIVESQSELDLEHSVRLIFRPGFSTVEAASDISGRGVGLDVVENAVEVAGGELRVSSQPGDGATFEIRLPVTFGLMEATIVVSGGHRYCIAASQTVRGSDPGPSGDEVQISMRKLLGQSDQTDSLGSDATVHSVENPEGGEALICRFVDEPDGSDGHRLLAVTVDHIEGTEQVLVRSLGRHAGRWYGVAGATELSDGSTALVLDLPRLLADS